MITAQLVADLLAATTGVNATSLWLPTPAPPRARADAWDEWVAAQHPFLGCVVPGGEFLAFPLTLDGQDVTVVLFSWNQGGFEGATLVEGHPTTLTDAAEMWLGDTLQEEYDTEHPIHSILDSTEPPEEEDEACENEE